MGNKAAARTLMQSVGVPVVPGSDGPVRDAAEAGEVADAIGYPVLIKAAAGGGKDGDSDGRNSVDEGDNAAGQA